MFDVGGSPGIDASFEPWGKYICGKKKKNTNSDIELRSLSVRPLTNVFIIPFFI